MDLAKAKRELETENLRVDNSLQFGDDHKRKATRGKHPLPRAEITPQGDFLIEGKRQAIDASQRRQLLVYRGPVSYTHLDGYKRQPSTGRNLSR